jgi:hypothetical protein
MLSAKQAGSLRCEDVMKLTHKFEEMTPDKRPQYPHMDGTGLRFETLDHGGDERPDCALRPCLASAIWSSEAKFASGLV